MRTGIFWFLLLSELPTEATQNLISMKILAFAVLAGTVVQSGLACDLCAIYSASQAKGQVGHGWFAGLAEQYTHFGTVQVDGHPVADPSHQYLNSSISQLFGGYNFSERFGAQFNLPVVYRAFRRPDSMGGIQTGTESGIGDSSILLTGVPYRVHKKGFAFNWNVLAGVKLPTGNSDRIKEEVNEVEKPVGPPSGIHGHDLTLGSGSADAIVGTGVYGRWDKFYLTANVQYALRTTGDFNYRFANDLTWSGGPGYFLLLRDNYTLSLGAVVSGENKDKDTFRGEQAEDTGMTAVYLGPELSLTWGEHLSAYLVADLPVSLANTSLQTVPDYRIRGGVTWRF
jgi:hypothetical protein